MSKEDTQYRPKTGCSDVHVFASENGTRTVTLAVETLDGGMFRVVRDESDITFRWNEIRELMMLLDTALARALPGSGRRRGTT